MEAVKVASSADTKASHKGHEVLLNQQLEVCMNIPIARSHSQTIKTLHVPKVRESGFQCQIS